MCLTYFVFTTKQVLWPYLLEFLIPVQYTEAFGVVCKNLAELGERKKQADDADYLIDYEDESKLISCSDEYAPYRHSHFASTHNRPNPKTLSPKPHTQTCSHSEKMAK